MNSITFSRIIKNGLLNYRRNFGHSLAATAIMVITIFIIGSFLVINSLGNISVNSLKEKVDISVYFKLETQDALVEQIEQQVRRFPEVRSVTFIPKVEARERFRELHRDEPLLLESLSQFEDDENPFPASLAIRLYELEDYQKIISVFEDEKFRPFVAKITDKGDVVERINQIVRGFSAFLLALLVVFVVLTIIIIFSTIKFAIETRKEEIEIMRLVGASNTYIRGPFVIEGMIYGLAGGAAAFVFLFLILWLFTPAVSRFLEVDITRYGYFGENLWKLFATQVVLGVVLGIISATIVVRRYLKI